MQNGESQHVLGPCVTIARAGDEVSSAAATLPLYGAHGLRELGRSLTVEPLQVELAWSIPSRLHSTPPRCAAGRVHVYGRYPNTEVLRRRIERHRHLVGNIALEIQVNKGGELTVADRTEHGG